MPKIKIEVGFKFTSSFVSIAPTNKPPKDFVYSFIVRKIPLADK